MLSSATCCSEHNENSKNLAVALSDPAISDNETNEIDDNVDAFTKGDYTGNEAELSPVNDLKLNEMHIDKETDTVDALIVESISMRTRFMIFCVLLLCYFHCGAQSGLFLVIPFYVYSTPEHGWIVADLSIIFFVFNIGGLVAVQICGISGCAKTEKNRNRIIMIGHCSQFAMGIVGSVIMSSVLGFNMGAFFVGAFLGGFSTDSTIIEWYGPLISDCDEVQALLLGCIGKVFLIAGIVNSFLLPAIYQHFGFGPFCGTLIALEFLALITLFILWFMIHQNAKSSASGNAVTGKSPVELQEVRDDSEDEVDTEPANPPNIQLKDSDSATATLKLPAAGVKPKMMTIESGYDAELNTNTNLNPVQGLDAVPDLHIDIKKDKNRRSRVSRWTPNNRDAAKSGWTPNGRGSALSVWTPRSPFNDVVRFRAMTHSKWDAMTVYPVANRVSRGMSMFPDTVMAQTLDTKTSSKRLSAPSLVLLAISFLTAVSGSLYVSSFALPFVEDFGVDSEVSGYLDATANVFSFLVLSAILKFASNYDLLQYPFDILMTAGVIAAGNLLFAVVYAEWIAYTVHWVIRRMAIVVMGCELVSRLYLCPPAAFGAVTSIGGTLKTIGYLIGGTSGPLLFTASHKLPFIVVGVLNILLCVIVGVFYVYRLRILSGMEFDDETKGHYLLMERADNLKSESVELQEVDKEHVTEIRRITRYSVTASDVVWHKDQ